MTFDQVWEYTKNISSETAFSRVEGEALFDTLIRLEEGSRVVEVGCEFGRSTSIIAQVVKENGHDLTLIDPFISSVDQRPMTQFASMLEYFKIPFTLHCMTTEQAVSKLPMRIQFVHIDGDHEKKGIAVDCRILLPRLTAGGYACFHDYGRESLPDVKQAVDHHIQWPGWSMVGVFETLLIVRRKAENENDV